MPNVWQQWWVSNCKQNGTMSSYDSSSSSVELDLSDVDAFTNVSPDLQALQSNARNTLAVHKMTDLCWDTCVDSVDSSLGYRTETCLANCTNRFIDASLFFTNRFTQMMMKAKH